MQIELDLSEDQKQEVQDQISRAVNNVLAKLMKPELPVMNLGDEPDWNSVESIEQYIRHLKSEGDRFSQKRNDGAKRLNEVADVQQRVRELLDAAVRQITERKIEVSAAIQKIESDGREIATRTYRANEKLAELLKSREQLERLAALEGTVRTLCENFDAWGKARHYQVDGILSAVSAYMNGKQGFLDADDMGLGKTFKATVLIYILSALFVQEHNREPRILWMTKKSLIKSNTKEIKKWYPNLAIIPNLGTTPETRKQFFEFAQMTKGVLVCSYEQVRDTENIRHYKWDLVFADEVHRLKGGANNTPTQIWTVVRDVCRKSRFMYFLSGTPIVNEAKEMWSYLHIFAPERFPKAKDFMLEFTHYKWVNGEMLAVVDVDKLMNRALAGQMIHRTKTEVGMELPDKDRIFYDLQMDGKQLALYEQMRTSFYIWLDGQDEKKALSASVIIAHINRLRQIALDPVSIQIKDENGHVFHVPQDTEAVKLEQCVDMVEEIGEQVVIFSAQFNGPLKRLESMLTKIGKSVAVIDASTSDHTSDFEEQFQNGTIDCLLINMMTGSEGLNLHKSPENWPGGASHAIMLDLWWNPAKNVQAEDRIWRDGCKEPVTIHILQCEDSADAFVKAKVDEKADTIGKIMDRDELRPPSQWRDLLEGLI